MLWLQVQRFQNQKVERALDEINRFNNRLPMVIDDISSGVDNQWERRRQAAEGPEADARQCSPVQNRRIACRSMPTMPAPMPDVEADADADADAERFHASNLRRFCQ